MKFQFKLIREGVLLAVITGLVAWFISMYVSSLNSILLALAMGILMGNLIKIPPGFQAGITFTSGKLLEFSILFLAFSINYNNIAALGWEIFAGLVVLVLAVLMISYYLSRKFSCPGSTGWLIGFGTAICGSSAIAALAPAVSKDKEDVGIAMAVVNLMGALGMMVLPFILGQLNLSSGQNGILIGGTLHSVGNVAGAAFSLNNETGAAAITVKLARVALLSPGLIFFNYLINRNEVSNWKQHFKLPWYLYGFIFISILTSVISFPDTLLKSMDLAGKIILTIAMAAIGLRISFPVLFNSGKRGMGFGLVIFVVQIVLLVLIIMASAQF